MKFWVLEGVKDASFYEVSRVVVASPTEEGARHLAAQAAYKLLKARHGSETSDRALTHFKESNEYWRTKAPCVELTDATPLGVLCLNWVQP